MDELERIVMEAFAEAEREGVNPYELFQHIEEAFLVEFGERLDLDFEFPSPQRCSKRGV